MEGWSDLVFGVALSIGALLFGVQESPRSQGTDAEAIAVFGFSFLIPINAWKR